MNCTIYRSKTKAYTYLYLAEGKELDDLPEGLLIQFGQTEMVMELDLSSRSKLAYADLQTVKSQLLTTGYYLQFPPEQGVDELLNRRFSSPV